MRFGTMLTPRDGKFLLGLDVGRAAIKAVALARTAHGPCLAAAGEIPVAAPAGGDAGNGGSSGAAAATRDAIAQLLDRLGIAPPCVARVATALGGASVVVGEIEVPRMPARELRRALPWEVRKHVPDEEWVVDHEVLGPDAADPGKVRVRYAGVDRTQLEARIALLRQVGLEAQHVEPAAASLARACHGLLADLPAETRLGLDIGQSGTTLVIGAEDGALLSRYLEIGLGTPAGDEPELVRQARLGGESLDELVLEVRRSIAFFASHHGGSRVARAVLAGGGAVYPPLAVALAARLDVPVRTFAYRGNHAVPRLEPPWAVAYGLAARLAS
jgi:type IV pilus assembly protein PilM